MKNTYKLSLSIIAALLIGNASMNAQVYSVNGYLFPGGVSDTGVVSLQDGNAVYIWDQINGLVQIGDVGDYSISGKASITRDGKKIGASSINPGNGFIEMSLYDVTTSQWQTLGGISSSASDGELSSGWAMSGDGTTVVGLGWVSGFMAHAIKWTAAEGTIDLGSTVAGSSSRANGISEDKTTIIGWQDLDDGFRAGAKWVNGVQEFIYDNNGDYVSEASAVSGDGKTIVGSDGTFPFIWNQDTGYQTISHPDSGMFFRGSATAISADGNTIVGFFRPWPGPALMGEGFIWTKTGGMKNLNDFVTAGGLDAAGITFSLPLEISKDGKKITGTGLSGGAPVAFMIDISNILATQEVKNVNLSIAPNPVKDHFTIFGGKVEKVEIYNIAGQKVKTPIAIGNQFDATDLSKGIYLVKVFSGGKEKTLKLIKE